MPQFVDTAMIWPLLYVLITERESRLEEQLLTEYAGKLSQMSWAALKPKPERGGEAEEGWKWSEPQGPAATATTATVAAPAAATTAAIYDKFTHCNLDLESAVGVTFFREVKDREVGESAHKTLQHVKTR